MIIQFLFWGLLPLLISLGYFLNLIGYGLKDIICIILAVLLFQILVKFIPLFKIKSDKDHYIAVFIIVFLTLAGFAIKAYMEKQKWDKFNQNMESKIETVKKEVEKELGFIKRELAIIKSNIVSGEDSKDIYKKDIPKPQNWEDAFKQHVEADYEFRKENYEIARKIYLNVLEDYAKSEELISILKNSIGATYENSGQHEEAIKWFGQAKEYKNYQLNILENIAVSYYKLGEYDRAIQEYKIMADKKPGDFSINNKLGILYALNGQYDNAIEQFEIAIDNGFIKKGIYFNLAQSYGRKGPEFDNQLILYLEKELEFYPEHAVALFQLGAAYCWQGQCKDKGVKLIEKAVLIDNTLLNYFPMFGLPQVTLPPLGTIEISFIKIYPDYTEVTYTIKKQ